MPTLKYQILELAKSQPGLTDREVTNALRSRSDNQQPINQAARQLESAGLIARRRRNDGLIGNYIATSAKIPESKPAPSKKNHDVDALSEDEIKHVLNDWLTKEGWDTEVAWRHTRGIDIDAKRRSERWIIEVKGPGSRQPMRVNYFIGILGETLQRMDDRGATYSIALPDLAQYRGLWDRLPKLAKQRTKISIIFVSKTGKIEFLS